MLSPQMMFKLLLLRFVLLLFFVFLAVVGLLLLAVSALLHLGTHCLSKLTNECATNWLFNLNYLLDALQEAHYLV